MSIENRLSRLQSLKSAGETVKIQKKEEQDAQEVQERARQEQESNQKEQEGTQIKEKMGESSAKLEKLTVGLQEAKGMDMEGFPEDIIAEIQAEISGIEEEIKTVNTKIQELQRRLDVLNDKPEKSTEGVSESHQEVQEVEDTEKEVTAESILEQAEQEITDSEDIPEYAKDAAIAFLKEIKDKDPRTVSWFAVLSKEFDPTLEKAYKDEYDCNSESRRVAGTVVLRYNHFPH
ncbi:MAG: hypothetical protein AUJ23_03050 [Candidatus Magasanikbacteria bacterium CG1_02_32_51]|uniref:Uncharacterized protein n=1 Tax=Candidatus Magasanikbacteria bacterium CG1_02_32_51 TaxID=1805238 RepID=A0A1J4U2W1_9BACT|nr:MAG: hypothetical protein AUJ23_03050 [Candidatus Magasanikbacteria bacterium CG1_02_32_51]